MMINNLMEEDIKYYNVMILMYFLLYFVVYTSITHTIKKKRHDNRKSEIQAVDSC